MLSEEQQKKGVIAASAGNHALALSYHGQDLGIPVTVVGVALLFLLLVSRWDVGIKMKLLVSRWNYWYPDEIVSMEMKLLVCRWNCWYWDEVVDIEMRCWVWLWIPFTYSFPLFLFSGLFIGIEMRCEDEVSFSAYYLSSFFFYLLSYHGQDLSIPITVVDMALFFLLFVVGIKMRRWV